jgi:hypothetical protein
MKIINIMILSSLLAVVAVPVAFACTNCAHSVAAGEYLKTHAQKHAENNDNEMALACSPVDPRCKP